jgi:leucyl aminopeptidase
MKFTFKESSKTVPKEALFISLSPKNTDEIVREGSVRTLYIKCDVEKKMTLPKLFLLIRRTVSQARAAKVKKIALNFRELAFDSLELNKLSDLRLGEILGSQIDHANYEFTKYKTPPKEGFNTISEVFIIGASKDAQKGILKGNAIAAEVNAARTLANTPGGDMTPAVLANAAKAAVKGTNIKVRVLGEKEMAKEKMEAILAVGRGSEEESKFIIMEYWGGSKSEKPIVLVGKGVTFDTGGINLKPSNSLLGMNMDMSGGAAVMHAIALAAKMKLRRNVVALIPSVENMASGKSYRPGDVIKSMSGATIEVLNTDAEGRVILADALTYSKKYDPSLVIDVATLTGAAMVALGERMSAVFTNDDKLARELIDMGAQTDDRLWQLPMWEEHEAEIKGNLGDWTNVHNRDSRYGGATHGAIFLYQFIKGTPWAHLDIAPRMTSMPGEFLSPGALGTPVRLLLKFLEEK